MSFKVKSLSVLKYEIESDTIFSDFGLLLIYLKICCLLHWIQSVNPHFLLPYIIMDLPIFVIAEWATLLVDNHCPRGGS